MEKNEHILLPIFHQPWWLDITCGTNNWGYSISKNNSGEIRGILPFYKAKLLGCTMLRMPPLTPYLGPFIIYPENKQKLHRKYSYEHEVMSDLINGLPAFSYFHQIFHYQIDNWLPFFNMGFKQTTRYTYVINDNSFENIFNGIDRRTKNRIRKAEKTIIISTDGSLKDFFKTIGATYKRQNMALPFDQNMFAKLHKAIQENGNGQLFFAKDKSGYIGAALYLVWDSKSTYLWQLGAEEGFRDTGAVQLLIWRAIQESVQRQLIFNFTGSMLQHIEPMLRGFGAERKSVHQIYKCSNRLFEAFRVLSGK